jgi:quinol monooxygenase YgiN
MSTIAAIAKIVAQDGKRDELIEAMGPLVDHVKANEPGTLTYLMNKDASDENVIWMYEEYEDQEALAAHGQSEQMKAFGMALRPLAAGRPEITLLTPVGGKGR